jgi:hypothetical protein
VRVALALAPLVAVSACCHNAEPPMEPYRKTPTKAAYAAFNTVKKKLGDERGEEANKLMSRFRDAIGNVKRENAQGPKSLAEEFFEGLHCGSKGCYSEMVANTPERALAISNFATGHDSELARWTGWRYLSGLYLADGSDGQTVDDRPQERRLAIVVLDGQPRKVRQ